MNVLLVGFETECCSLALLGKRLQAEGHDVLLVSGDYHNFINDVSIREFYRDHDFDDWANFEEPYRRLYTEEWTVDWEYLRSFEDSYCVNKNFQQLLLTDHILSRHHHWRRPYYTPIESSDQVYYWAERLTRWIESIYEDFQPDLVFTYKRNYFVKNAVAQMAMATETPLLTLIHSRIRDKCLLSRNFGLGPDPDAREYVQNPEAVPLERGRSFVRQFRDADDFATLYDATSQERVGDERLFEPSSVVGEFGSKTIELVKRRFVYRQKTKYGNVFTGNYFDSNAKEQLKLYTRVAINKLRYCYLNPFSRSIPDRPFVYYPLHTLPESSTLTLSTEYFETDVIRFISKELPADVALAVKENPNMVGLRPFEVYAELDEIPNVEVIDPLVPSKRLASMAEGVCGISGTALLEAAVLGKPTHAFGEPEFLDVVDFTGHDEFSDFVDVFGGDGPTSDDEVAAYVQYVFDTGLDIDLYKLRNKQDTPEFEAGLDEVYEVLSDHIEAHPRTYSPEPEM